jgi:hypothetical protein
MSHERDLSHGREYNIWARLLQGDEFSFLLPLDASSGVVARDDLHVHVVVNVHNPFYCGSHSNSQDHCRLQP